MFEKSEKFPSEFPTANSLLLINDLDDSSLTLILPALVKQLNTKQKDFKHHKKISK